MLPSGGIINRVISGSEHTWTIQQNWLCRWKLKWYGILDKTVADLWPGTGCVMMESKSVVSGNE